MGQNDETSEALSDNSNTEGRLSIRQRLHDMRVVLQEVGHAIDSISAQAQRDNLDHGPAADLCDGCDLVMPMRAAMTKPAWDGYSIYYINRSHMELVRMYCIEPRTKCGDYWTTLHGSPAKMRIESSRMVYVSKRLYEGIVSFERAWFH